MNSPEVVRAQRTLEAAKALLSNQEQQLAETKLLLNRGIVSRNEYEGLLHQRESQELTIAGALQDIDAAVERGSADNQRLADLEYRNARARLDDLQHQLDGSVIRASTTGILTRSRVGIQSPQGPTVIEPGVHVSRGQPLLDIADTATLVVSGKVDEVDVSQVRVGQPVTIESDAFLGKPIEGRIVSVSAEAGPDSGSHAPFFEVRAAFQNVGDTQYHRVRIGMSARVTAVTYVNPKAIIIPIEAIRNVDKDPAILIRDPVTQTEQLIRVSVGTTTEAGIEILNGLSEGTIVVLR
jgi:hypothetical protein